MYSFSLFSGAVLGAPSRGICSFLVSVSICPLTFQSGIIVGDKNLRTSLVSGAGIKQLPNTRDPNFPTYTPLHAISAMDPEHTLNL